MLFWSSFSDPAVPDEGVKQERTYTFCTYLEQNLRSKGRQKTPHLRERITDEDKLSLMGDCKTQRIHPWFPLRSKDTLQRGQAWICSLDSPNLSWSRTERRLSTWKAFAMPPTSSQLVTSRYKSLCWALTPKLRGGFPRITPGLSSCKQTAAKTDLALTHPARPEQRGCGRRATYPCYPQRNRTCAALCSDSTALQNRTNVRNPQLCWTYTSFSARMYIMVTSLLLNISQSLIQCYLYCMTIGLERGKFHLHGDEAFFQKAVRNNQGS